MRLDTTYLAYITKEELRVLLAVEMGMKNHEYVPVHLVEKISKLKRANTFSVLCSLLKNKLVSHTREKYDGYKLTYLGYDYLALNVFFKRGHITKVHGKMGVGKESDIYKCENADGHFVILKFERLGRTSFKTIKRNRDYLKNRHNYNWLYLSRLASVKEYLYMQVLFNNGFPTPKPIDWNRHGVVMSLVDGYTLCALKDLENPESVFQQCVDLLERFAQHGLIHSDFNEFNLMMTREQKLMVIDFPQMVSTSHLNAQFYFERDQDCINTFFSRRFKCPGRAVMSLETIKSLKRLDVEVKASGCLANELNHKDDLDLIDDLRKGGQAVVEQEQVDEQEDHEELEDLEEEGLDEESLEQDVEEEGLKDEEGLQEEEGLKEEGPKSQHQEPLPQQPQEPELSEESETEEEAEQRKKRWRQEKKELKMKKPQITPESLQVPEMAEEQKVIEQILESDKKFIKGVIKKKYRNQYKTKKNVNKQKQRNPDEEVEDFYLQ